MPPWAASVSASARDMWVWEWERVPSSIRQYPSSLSKSEILPSLPAPFSFPRNLTCEFLPFFSLRCVPCFFSSAHSESSSAFLPSSSHAGFSLPFLPLRLDRLSSIPTLVNLFRLSRPLPLQVHPTRLDLTLSLYIDHLPPVLTQTTSAIYFTESWGFSVSSQLPRLFRHLSRLSSSLIRSLWVYLAPRNTLFSYEHLRRARVPRRPFELETDHDLLCDTLKGLVLRASAVRRFQKVTRRIFISKTPYWTSITLSILSKSPSPISL